MNDVCADTVQKVLIVGYNQKGLLPVLEITKTESKKKECQILGAR